MYRQEQIRLMFVGDLSPCFKRNEGIVRSRVDHLGSHAGFDQRAEAFGNVQDQVLFQQPGRTECPGIMATVARVENDSPDFQAQDTRHRVCSIAEFGWLGRL